MRCCTAVVLIIRALLYLSCMWFEKGLAFSWRFVFEDLRESYDKSYDETNGNAVLIKILTREVMIAVSILLDRFD